MIRILIIDFTKSVYVMSGCKIILIGSIYASGMFLLFMKHIRIVTFLQPCFHPVILFELQSLSCCFCLLCSSPFPLAQRNNWGSLGRSFTNLWVAVLTTLSFQTANYSISQKTSKYLASLIIKALDFNHFSSLLKQSCFTGKWDVFKTSRQAF